MFDRFDRRLDGRGKLLVRVIRRRPQALGEIARADFGGVAGDLRGARVLGRGERRRKNRKG